LNRVIRRLTALTILVAIPNIITGFYGMNLGLPGAEDPSAHLWVLGTIAVSVTALVTLFLKNRWF
jgi:magnesium transporter